MGSPQPTLRPGDQLASPVCGTRVVVIRAPAQGRPSISCAGSLMVPAATVTAASPDEGKPVTLIGKRYVGAAGALELLCTASGSGELSCDGEPMALKAAKPLPASD